MKVGEGKGVLGSRLGGVDAVHPSGTPAPPVASAGADRVSVSPLGRELAHLRGEIGDLDAINEERVVGLRAVMAEGHYSADFQHVARKLLRELLGQLLG